MGQLAGVCEVKYDCKTATVTMRGEAGLAEEVVRAALLAHGFKLSSFAPGTLPSVTACVIALDGLRPERLKQAEQALGTLNGRRDAVLIDSTGFTTLVSSDASVPPRESVAAALTSLGCAVSAIETRTWPRTCAEYEVQLGGIAADAWPRTRALLAGLDKVVTAQVFAARGAALLRLNEPCSTIEPRVRAALRAAGGEVTAFTLLSARR